MMSRNQLHYDVFGIHLLSNYQLSIPCSESPRNADIEFLYQEQTSSKTSSSHLVYSSPYKDTNGISHYRLFVEDGCQVICLSSGIKFQLESNRILCTSEVGVDPSIESGLLGAVLALWLENHDILALHASAVEVGGRSIIFLSSSLGGKSSLAASFLEAGFSLISDDIVPLEKSAGAHLSRPGYPTVRLWPDEARFFLGRLDDLETENAFSDKLRIPVGSGRFGMFTREKRPVACIYLPRRYSPDGTNDLIDIIPLSARDALIESMRYSFIARMAEAAGMGPARLKLLSEVAKNVPVRRLVYPNGYEYLRTVREAVLSDLHYLQKES